MKRLRRGNSLLEVLVSIAIVAILLGLFLSAVQAVRQAANRVACQNQFKQIGLAAHMAHDVNGILPAPPHVRNTQPFRYIGWLPFLLPYVEQDAMWRELEEDYRAVPTPFLYDRPHRHIGTVVPLFGCPADERTRTAWTIPAVGRTNPVAMASYLGNAGTSYQARDGVLYKGAKTKLLHISDGTSSTILAGERPPSPEMYYGWWYAGAGIRGTTVLDMTMTVRETLLRPDYSWYQHCPPGPHKFQPRRTDDFCGVMHYWSVHHGGAFFAFCDGSVRFLRYEANDLLPALATRAGGETIALPD